MSVLGDGGMIVTNNDEIANINKNVNKIMKNYKKEMRVLNEKKASDLASVPLEEQVNIQAIERFVYLGNPPPTFYFAK